MTGKAFGAQSPTQGEEAASWATWSDGAGGAAATDGGADWGRLKLPLSGGEARSVVVDLGYQTQRTFTAAQHRYGSGSGSAVLQIRGGAATFAQDSDVPVWEEYAGAVTGDWRYVQIGVTTKALIDQSSGTVTTE